MNRIIIVILICCSIFSCGNRKKTETAENKTIDLVKIAQDSIQREILLQEAAKAEEQRKQDSIDRHIADSRQYINYIKRNRNISTKQRVSRIKKLYNTIINNMDLYSTLYDDGIDALEIAANEIGMLLTDTNIVNYNIDSIFTSIRDDCYNEVGHSADNRLWVISVVLSIGANGGIPANIIAWRDTCNRPRGFLTSFTEDHIEGVAWWNKIYKLNNTEKDLYLMFGYSKGYGNNAMIVELTNKGINLKYGGFKTKEGGIGNDYFVSGVSNEITIDGKAVIYNLGLNLNGNYNMINYKFNEKTQTISFRKNARNKYGWDSPKADTLIIGTLTFNGKYFTEKLRKIKHKDYFREKLRKGKY